MTTRLDAPDLAADPDFASAALAALNASRLTDRQKEAVWRVLVRGQTLAVAGAAMGDISRAGVLKSLRLAFCKLPMLERLWATRCRGSRAVIPAGRRLGGSGDGTLQAWVQLAA